MPDLTIDSLYEGDLELEQPRYGNRFSVDAVALSEWVRITENSRILELGTGSGIIALILARREPSVTVVALELQSELARLAGSNVSRNGFDSRVKVIHGDLRDHATLWAARSFDSVVFNPPYHPVNSGRLNPNASRAAARHELHGGLADFIVAARYSLEVRGRLSIVYPAWRIPVLLQTLVGGGFTPVRLAFAHAGFETPAALVLVEAVLGGGPMLTVEAPILLQAVV